MAELTDARIDAALERGRAARRHEPRATAARYECRNDRHPFELSDLAHASCSGQPVSKLLTSPFRHTT